METMNPEILAQEGYVSVSVENSPVRELFPGIRVRPLWQCPAGAKAAVLEMDPGTCPRAPPAARCSSSYPEG
jgi:hypothetical protein